MQSVISADGTSISFARAGYGAPVVLVHGTGRDRSCWARALPGLARYSTVYSVDRRGRGDSGDAEHYSIDQEVQDILAVIQEVGEPVHLLGHSYGAIIALEAASRTGRLRSLILYEPPFSVGTDGVPSDLGDRLAATLATGTGEAVLLDFLREGPRYTSEEIAAQRARCDWSRRVAFAHTLPREVQTVGRYIFDRDTFTKLRVPTLLLLGSESPSFFQQTARTLNAVLPQCELVVLEGQYHNAMETAHALWVDVVQRFLNAQNGGEQP